MVSFKMIFTLLTLLIMILSACETLKESKPIYPIKEYERMLAGRLDADYVGTENCLAACHAHDRIRRDFDASTMGVQLSEKTGLPLVNCESCHGPGSLAIAGLTPEKVEEDARQGVKTECNHKTFIDIDNLPAQAKSLICLKCHTANATFNLHEWNISGHAINDVSCSDCHIVHAGPDMVIDPRDTVELCFSCHDDERAEFLLPSHHPIMEKRVVCIDCHQPHGTTNERLLKGETVKETCTVCHAEKEGPFLYEHSETTEDCRICHHHHGAVNNNLLHVPMPFLCLQCHEGHNTNSTSTVKPRFYTRCTDCHSQIHGTDIPSASGKGMFSQ
jgi:DmsE family decaheme c-type cytochrome